MERNRFHGLELPVRRLSGARALRIVHPPRQRIGEHRHDWPLLTIPALGGYREECDERAVAVDGPAAILHPAGCCHANCIHDRGMETFSIEFDPDWLGGMPLDRSHYWIGGDVALASRALAQLWQDSSVAEDQLRRSTAGFLKRALRLGERPRPHWFGDAARLAKQSDLPTHEIARRLNLHPAWLAQAYRLTAGEGLGETRRRQRLETAVALLRDTDQPIADIAAASGFCDQSHLNRAARALLGRTPAEIRLERGRLRELAAA